MNKSCAGEQAHHNFIAIKLQLFVERVKTITGISLMFKSELFLVMTVNLSEVAFRFQFDFNVIRF